MRLTAAPRPDDLAAAMDKHRDELVAAVCVLDPPVAWLMELAHRCRRGFVFVPTRTGSRGGKLTYRITPEVLAAAAPQRSVPTATLVDLVHGPGKEHCYRQSEPLPEQHRVQLKIIPSA